MRPLRPLHTDPPRSSFRLAWLAVLTLGMAATAGPPASAAGGEPFILLQGEPWKLIPDSDLIDGSEPVVETTPPQRGSVIDLAGSLLYQPSPKFFEHGSDSFHYSTRVASGSYVWGTAFLAAGMRGDGAFFMALDDPAELELVTQVNGHLLSPNDSQPIHGAYDLRVQLLPGTPAYVTFQRRGGNPGDGPKGGTLGSGIDGGGGIWDQDAELIVGVSEDLSGQAVARATLAANGPELELFGEVSVGGVFVPTASAPIAVGSTWELQWWGATAAGSRDGGALLVVDGAVVTRLDGLDNPELERPAKWSFGALQGSGFEGAIQLDDLRGEAARTAPRLAPVFADPFEAPALTPVWSGGECGEGSLPAPEQGRLRVSIDPQAEDCYLSRQLDAPLRQLKARFTFDPASAVIGTGSAVSLLRGRSSGSDVQQVEVALRRSFGGALEIHVGFPFSESQPLDPGWIQVSESAETTVELHWWAATSPGTDDGGLRWSRDGELVEEWLELGNQGAVVDELRLGAMGVGAGHAGTLAFEVIEVWR